MTMDVLIRLAEPKDIAAISQLCAAHTAYEKADFKSDGHEDRLTRELTSKDSALVVHVADRNGCLIGYASTTKEFSTWQARHYLHLDCLFVSESERENGIGKDLMNGVISYARSSGIAEIQWQTPDWNDRAISFYRQLSARDSGRRRFSYSV